jgi:hypothetical protein
MHKPKWRSLSVRRSSNRALRWDTCGSDAVLCLASLIEFSPLPRSRSASPASSICCLPQAPARGLILKVQAASNPPIDGTFKMLVTTRHVSTRRQARHCLSCEGQPIRSPLGPSPATPLILHSQRRTRCLTAPSLLHSLTLRTLHSAAPSLPARGDSTVAPANLSSPCPIP